MKAILDRSKVIYNMKNNHKQNISGLASLLVLILFIGLIAVIVSGCQGSPTTTTPTASPTFTSTSTITPLSPTSPAEGAVVEPTEEQVLSTPTPAPTATPSQLDFVVEDITQRVGILDVYTLTRSG